MKKNGNFDYLNFSSLFSNAGENRFSGELYFSEAFREYRVFFKSGKISFIASSDRDERFGEFLVVNNKITFEQYRITSEKILQEGKKFGYTLIEEGFMTVEELYNSLYDYMFFLLGRVFSLKEGVYSLIESEEGMALPMDLTIDYRKAIYLGMKQNDFFSLVNHFIPDLSASPYFLVSVEDIFKILPLTVEEQGVLEWVDGQNSFSSICNYSDLSQFDTLRLLLILKFSGFIDFKESDSLSNGEVNVEDEVEDLLGKYNSFFERIYSVLNTFSPELFEKMNVEVFDTLEERYPELVRDIDFSGYGYIDFDAFLRNLYNAPGGDKISLARNFLEDALKESMYFIEDNCEKELYSSLKKVIYAGKD